MVGGPVMEKNSVIIANASGFWGDEAAAVVRQVRGGHIDYLTMDYLAEITMIILARQKAASEDAGYARDFVRHLDCVLEEIAERGITVIAGAGVAFPHLETGEPLGERLDVVNSANAYIGARPIVDALERGARIVVTGRTYDAASVVAPMIHELGWSWEDHDRMAAALLAGHLIECGAQATGGNYTRWKEVESCREIGYPIVEASADGSFVLTKHADTGGIVNVMTATEQILYEIGDPRTYHSPDVVADFTSCALEQVGTDRVCVSGVRGRPPTDSLKVSMAYDAGGRPSVSPTYGYWPALLPRSCVTARTLVGGERVEHPCDVGPTAPVALAPEEASVPASRGAAARVKVPLSRVAYGRSGDKGDTCDVGIAALRPEIYPELVRELTPQRVASHFRSNVHGPVRRYRLDNLHALNFTMQGALGGGGTVSLLVDTQGKTAAQGLLTMEVDVAGDLLEASGAGG